MSIDQKQDRVYVMPEAAKKKMQAAKKKKQPVYIFGATYYGKTEFVKQFLQFRNYRYFSCYDREYAEHEILNLSISDSKSSPVIVIDDLQSVCGERTRQKIGELIERNDIWLILIGRCPMPSWMIASRTNVNMMIISEDDLRFGKKEIRDLFQCYDLEPTEEEILHVEKYSEGNVFGILQTIYAVQNGDKIGPELTRKNTELMAVYIEKNVLFRWDEEVLDFLIKVSVVDEFNLDLAEFITGDSSVYKVFERVSESGNFLFQNGDMYRLRTQLLLALRNYGLKEHGHERMKAYQYSAGLYYELHDRLDDALKMYELSGHHTKIRDILLRNARRNPATGFYFELRKYYLSLTEDEIKKEPELMAALSMLHSILMQPEESEYWYETLETYAKSIKGSARREAEARLAYLKVALPHRGVKGLTEILVSISKLILSHDMNLPEFSLTSNLPSVMTGGKDFSEWSKHDRELAFSIGKPITIVLGKFGKGLVSEALGESFFEKGENNYETLKLLTRAQLEVENGGKKELEFAIVGTLCRLHLVSGELSLAQSQLESFEKTLGTDISKQLYGNLEALRCRFYFFENNRMEIQKWMERAPDENEVFFVMERYRYLTKVRGYILNADYMRGLSLLEKLRYYAEQCSRPYLLMETDLLQSIILERMGEEWQELFLKMLDKACEYHFVRVISLEGAAVFPLLKKIRSRYIPDSKTGKEWWHQVYAETEKVARYYPGYLSEETVSSKNFSENALRILQLQAEGMTIHQIAQVMGLAETTIKYHASETYRKLNVKGKTDAVQKAKSLKII